MKLDIKPLDAHAVSEARKRQNELLKPAGSLGELEEFRPDCRHNRQS